MAFCLPKSFLKPPQHVALVRRIASAEVVQPGMFYSLPANLLDGGDLLKALTSDFSDAGRVSQSGPVEAEHVSSQLQLATLTTPLAQGQTLNIKCGFQSLSHIVSFGRVCHTLNF